MRSRLFGRSRLGRETPNRTHIAIGSVSARGCGYMPPPYMALAGTVQGKPGADRAGLLDVAEWAGVLQSVSEVKERFVCVELGAGYGPIVVGSAVAAKLHGIENVRLIAVEGDATHIEWMREHFRDNGLDPSQHKLICGVVGTYDGTAKFPKLTDPASDYGAKAIFTGSDKQAGRTSQMTVDAFIEVECHSLPTILKDVERADVVHFDIQGSEVDVIESGIGALNAKAHRLVIGTHGRDLEQQLLHLLDRAGWVLEIDKACTFQQQPPHGITPLQDGVQVWRNPKV